MSLIGSITGGGGGGGSDLPTFMKVGNRNALETNLLSSALIRFLGTGQPVDLAQFGANWSGPFPAPGTTLEGLGFEGSVVPPSGPLLDSAFQRTASLGTGAPTQARLAQLASLVSAQPALELDPAQREQFFKQSVADPAMQRFERDTIPAILARFGSGGQTGAIREELARAGTDLQTNLAGIQSGLLRDDERLRAGLAESAQQRSLSAIGALRDEELFPISAQAQIGDLQRSIVGQQNQEALFRALLATPYGDPRLSMLPLIGGSATSGSPMVGGGFSPLASLAGLNGGY